ncbi:MAG: DUF1349 domain-containing protein [Candidatus Bipolaricaulota bacterium]|nr:DUF1349 domain-containing protein [Candidatus Bipolaricaulota bacterium]
MKKIDFQNGIPEDFYWFNEPENHHLDEGLVIKTNPETDFWQRTHYGFKRDNGHCLLTELEEGFSFSAHFEFEPENLYDQSGLIVRVNKDNWIKVSTEYEDGDMNKLGSVVTNLGFSDWASTDISSEISSMWYRVKSSANDFLIENSLDGEDWSQMRVAHLHKETDRFEVGIYACSPRQGRFNCKVDEAVVGKSDWG